MIDILHKPSFFFIHYFTILIYEVLLWKKNDFMNFITLLSLQIYVPYMLEANVFKPKPFLSLTEETIKIQLQMKSYGHRKTLLRAIEMLKKLNPDLCTNPIKVQKYKEEELFEKVDDPFIRSTSNNSHFSVTSNELPTLVPGISKESESVTSSFGRDSKKTIEKYRSGEY